jgi:hypothetical protein
MPDHSFARFAARLTACHMVTYFVAGVFAYVVFDYETVFQSEHLACYMMPIHSKWVAIGPGLQWIRGLIFAAALYPFRHVFLDERRGWLKLWGLVVGLAILSTAGPAPGSVEGLLYTQLPVVDQLLGLREVVAQTLAFSWLLVTWYRRPHRAWGPVMYGLSALVVVLAVLGAVVPRSF